MKRKTVDLWRQPKWRLLVFRRAMTHASTALVISALISGVCRSLTHFMFAACAAGVLLLGGSWRDYCRWRDGKPLGRRPSGVPYSLCRDRSRRPAFLIDSADFDDDLTPYTAVAEEDFSDEACRRARVAAQALAGMLMIAISAVV